MIELLDTQTFFELLTLPYPTDQRGVLERLQQERLIDESAGSFAPDPEETYVDPISWPQS